MKVEADMLILGRYARMTPLASSMKRLVQEQTRFCSALRGPTRFLYGEDRDEMKAAI